MKLLFPWNYFTFPLFYKIVERSKPMALNLQAMTPLKALEGTGVFMLRLVTVAKLQYDVTMKIIV